MMMAATTTTTSSSSVGNTGGGGGGGAMKMKSISVPIKPAAAGGEKQHHGPNLMTGSTRTNKTSSVTFATGTVIDSVRSVNTAASSRSVGSAGSNGSSTTSSPSLRDNLMRTHQKDRNPYYYYEPVQVLGRGSMGSVTKVKKRDSVIGGSSREDYVMEIHGMEGLCFSLPIIGSILRHCTGRDLGQKIKRGKDLFAEPDPDDIDIDIDIPVVEVEEEEEKKQGDDDDHNNKNNKEKKKRSSSKKTLSRQGSSSFHSNVSKSKRKDLFYALKMIHMDLINDNELIAELQNEIAILKTVDHPNVIRPIETFHYKNNTCIIMELCEGGDLYTRDPYTELEAQRIITSVLSAIEYMHSLAIIHRDLKFENIMFCNKNVDSDVKVIDFGLSKRYQPNEHLHETSGTIYTMAPEVLMGDYDELADIWSLGVVAFMLLSSSLPFFGNDRRVVAKKILNCKFAMRGRRWRNVSQDSRNFVNHLLIRNPGDRPSATQALNEDWIKNYNNNNDYGIITTTSNSNDGSDGCSSVDSNQNQIMDNVQASIEAFSKYSTLKKLALMVIAHKSTSEEIGYLRRIFDKYDKSHHGMILFDDFQQALDGYGYSQEEIETMFHGCDLDGTGIIHYTEFLAATIETHGSLSEESIAEAFDLMDRDDSGYISLSNLLQMLGTHVPSNNVEDIILEAESELNYSKSVKKRMDSKPAKDHFISYEEFLALWDHQQEDKRLEALKSIEYRRRSSSSVTATTATATTTTTATTYSNNNRSPSSSNHRPLHEISEVSSMDISTIDIPHNMKNNNDDSYYDDYDGDDSTGTPSDVSLEADYSISRSQFLSEKGVSVRRYADI